MDTMAMRRSSATAVPTTSTTLLRDVSGDAQHARWGEFVARYRPMMEAFMLERFPSLDADEAIQRTLVALARALPSYRYVPDEKGAFHNYLTGILRHRALRMKAVEVRRTRDHAAFVQETERMPAETARDADERSWREAVFEVALQQYLADETVQERTRQVFVRLVVNDEKPEAVAVAFGLTRNAVDQIRSRALRSLRMRVRALECVDDAAFEHG